MRGRPDELLVKSKKSDKKLVAPLVGEVKYTEDENYARQGLKELMEYMAPMKRDDVYVEGREEVLKSGQIKGTLFLDQIKTIKEKSLGDNIQIIKSGDVAKVDFD